MSVPQSVPPKRTSAAARSLVMMDEITGSPSRVNNRGEAEVHTPGLIGPHLLDMHLPLSQLLFETASPEWNQRKVILTLITRRRMREVSFTTCTSPWGPFWHIFLQKKSRPSLLWTNQVLQHGISTPLPAIPTGCVRTPSGSGLHRNFLPTWH